MDTLIVITGIVKNESEKVIETFNPFISMFKNICIVDTGSEDDTIMKISELSKRIKIGHTDFENFSHARNIALMMCREEYVDSKFIFMVDVEWIVDDIDKLIKFCYEKENDDSDYYELNCIIDNELMIKIGCLIRLNSNCIYEKDLHETPIGKCGGIVPDVIIHVNQSNYGIEKTKNRNINYDIPYYLAKEKLTLLETFFLAQAYHNIKDYENAIKYYSKIAYEPIYSFLCNYRIGEIKFVTKKYNEAISSYFLAIIGDNDRCESYLRIAQLSQGKIKYDMAKIAYEKCKIINNGPFIDVTIYSYYKYIEMMKSCLAMKQYKEGLNIYQQYLNDRKLRDDETPQEIFFYKEKLQRKIVILILTSPGYEKFNEVMKLYLQQFDLEFYFYSFGDVEDITIIDNNIYIPGKETFIPGILDKTIKVFRMFSDYDYIVRLNSTTFIDLSRVTFGIEDYNEYISNQNENFNYYGYLSSIDLKENEKYGITKEFLSKYGTFPFISGKCIILSKQAVKYFLYHKINNDIMDDISIALSLKNQYPIVHNISIGENGILKICDSPECMLEYIKD